jgi:hypothetical protein
MVPKKSIFFEYFFSPLSGEEKKKLVEAQK